MIFKPLFVIINKKGGKSYDRDNFKEYKKNKRTNTK